MNEIVKGNSSFNKYLIKSDVDIELNGGYNEYKFDNGFGASVIRNDYSYGGKQGKFELAVLDNGDITYDTYITNNVEGYLTWEDVEALLEKIIELPMSTSKQLE